VGGGYIAETDFVDDIRERMEKEGFKKVP